MAGGGDSAMPDQQAGLTNKLVLRCAADFLSRSIRTSHSYSATRELCIARLWDNPGGFAPAAFPFRPNIETSGVSEIRNLGHGADNLDNRETLLATHIPQHEVH